MKLLRIGPRGAERPAVLDADGQVRDVSAFVPDYDAGFFAGGGLVRVRSLLADGGLPVIDPTGERVGAPFARPSNLLCIGLNYADHAAESGQPVPDEPVVFNKAPNTLVGPYDDVLLPPASETTDWEVELGIVVGDTARYLPSPAAAADVIAGYTICNDVSERASQLHRGGQWVKGKSFETFNPAGPWLVTADEVPDPQALAMRLWRNGELAQDGSTATMVFGVHHIVWYLSQFLVLEPGDLINTGTPPGVGMGMDPPQYLEEGDVLELEIDGLGRQRQACRRAQVEVTR